MCTQYCVGLIRCKSSVSGGCWDSSSESKTLLLDSSWLQVLTQARFLLSYLSEPPSTTFNFWLLIHSASYWLLTSLNLLKKRPCSFIFHSLYNSFIWRTTNDFLSLIIFSWTILFSTLPKKFKFLPWKCSLQVTFQITNYLFWAKLSDFSSEVIPWSFGFFIFITTKTKNIVFISHISLCTGDYFILVLNVYSCHQWMWPFLLEWH